MSDLEKYAEKFDVKNMVITMVLSGMAFLVALTWRDAIKATIDTYLPAGEGLGYIYLAALIVTLAAVVITYFLMKVKKMDFIPDELEAKVAAQTVGRAKRAIEVGSPFDIRDKIKKKLKGKSAEEQVAK